MFVNFHDLPNKELIKQYETFSKTLSRGEKSDMMDGKELSMELHKYPFLTQIDMTTLELLTL